MAKGKKEIRKPKSTDNMVDRRPHKNLVTSAVASQVPANSAKYAKS